MSHMNKLPCALMLSLTLGIGFANAFAQEATPDVTDAAPVTDAGLDPTLKSALTREFLETKIKETEAATDLDEAAKTGLTEQYRKAMSALEAANALEAKAGAYKQALETAPEQVKAIRETLASPDATRSHQPEALPDDATVTEVEQRLAKTQADAAAVAAKLAEIEKELESSAIRPAAARQSIAEAKRELESLETEIELPPPEGEAQALNDARRWTLIARRQSLRAQILMLDQELLTQDARVELLEAARDKATSDLTHLKADEQMLEGRLNELLTVRAADAAVEAKEAQREAEDEHALVQDLAERNAEISRELTAITEELNRFTGAQEDIEEQTRRIDEAFRSARQRLEAAGLTQTLGQILIDQRKRLPDLRGYRKATVEREDKISEANLREIRYDEEQRRLRNLDTYVEEILVGQVMDQERPRVAAKLRELAEQRRTLLDQASETSKTYLRVLGDLDYASSQLTEIAERYDDFLAERLIWVRSALSVSPETVRNLPKDVLWVIDPAHWLEVVRVLAHEATHSALFWLLLLTVTALEWQARVMRRRIRTTAEHLRRIRTDHIRYTLEALGLTLLLAAPLSLLLAILGWQLFASLEATSFTKAIGQAAISVSLGFYYLRAFRVLCMTGGVADRHFRWSGEILAMLRHNFDWLLVVLVPLGFIASAAYTYEDDVYSGSLGRLALIALMIGLAIFFGRVLNPQRGALRNLIAEHPEGWLNRMRRFWYPLVVAIPLALAVLTAIGYLYASATLLGLLASTMYLVLAITVLHQLIIRWLVVTRRRLALQAAFDRRMARAAAQEAETNQTDGETTEPDEAEEVDLATLGEQTRKLIHTLLFIASAVVLWLIWSPVLPAFGIFEDVALWHHQGMVNGEQRLIPVSLADIGLVLAIALIATVAAKNLPALLEILLLSRAGVSAGSRYAVKTLIGYTIVAVAALVAFSTLGLSWGQLQWLVAALGVGIGFGLQEIVANFISGIIILFERPIRVGDVVTVGDTTGAVSKIRIRATTIRNWDKQELLVPNKEFITGRLLNWTLSDNLNRVVITVGVDYGSDVTRALALLEEAANEHANVLEDPPPVISFEGFGDNALTLVLRCYLASLENRLATISKLHQSINEKFQVAGISIAFPQRDVHLSTAQPLDVRVHESSWRPT